MNSAPIYWLIPGLMLTLSLWVLSSSNAQTKSLVAPGVFLEGGGVAPDYSLNYTHPLFTIDKVSAYWRIGTGLWKKRLVFPLGMTINVKNDDYE